MQSRTRILLTITLAFILAGQVITATGQEIPVEMSTTKSMQDFLKQYQSQQYGSPPNYVPKMMPGYRQWPGYEVPYSMSGYRQWPNHVPHAMAQTPHVLPGSVMHSGPGGSPPPGLGFACFYGDYKAPYSHGAIKKHDDNIIQICLCSGLWRLCVWHLYTPDE